MTSPEAPKKIQVVPLSGRESMSSVPSLPTAEMKLPEELIAKLRDMAPKKKRSKTRWVILAALLLVVGSIAASKTMRQVIAERLGLTMPPVQATAVTADPSASAAPSASSAAPVPTTNTVVLSLDVTSGQPSASATASAVPTASVAPSASAAPTTKKPTTKKPTTKPGGKKHPNDGF